MEILSLGNMKNKFFITMFLTLILFYGCSVYADTQINLQIKTPNKTIFDNSITVTPCDSDGLGTLIDTPYCAILQSGVPSVWDWTWAPGAFITSLNGINGYTTKDKEDKDVYHYWSWSLNGSEAMDALNQYVLKSGDTISLNFIDPVDNIPFAVSGGGAYVTPVTKKVFSRDSALNFLASHQRKDGSFGASMYTDWVAIGAGDNDLIKQNLKQYILEHDINSLVLTDNERHAMALMALGIDPYVGTKMNYIKIIIDSFDGEQFGDKTLVNDDIFALIVLRNAGYSIDDEIIKKDISYILSKQNINGSWESVDLTAAALQALKGFENLTNVFIAINNAQNYIISTERADGGFNNTFTTSWVLQSFFSNEKILKAEDYLASKQSADGGMDSVDTNIDSRIWATAYTLPAMDHKYWSDILKRFPKEDISSSKIENKEIKVNLENKVIKKDTDISSQEKIEKINLLQRDYTEDNYEVSIWQKIEHKFSGSFNWLLDKLGF